MIFLSGATQVGTGVCMTTRAPVLLQSNSVEAFPGLIEPQKDRVMDVRWNTRWLFTSSTPAPLLPLWTFSFLPSWPLPVRSAFPGQHLTSTSLSSARALLFLVHMHSLSLLSHLESSTFHFSSAATAARLSCTPTCMHKLSNSLWSSSSNILN